QYATSNAVFEINAGNTYTGATKINGGQVYINGDSAFGNGGEVILNGGTTQQVVLRGDWNSSRIIQIGASSAVNAGLNTNGYNATWSGQMIGSSNSLTKNGNGNLIITEAMPFAGNFQSNAGTIVLKDRGSLAVTQISSQVSAGAALLLD